MRKRSTPRRTGSVAVVLATAVGLLASLTLATMAAGAPHHHGQKHSKHHKKAKARKASLPMSGIYDSCTMDSPKRGPVPDCADRLTVLRQGGFSVVLNYGTADMSLEDDLAYAEAAQAAGMRVIWNLGSFRNLNTGRSIPIEPKLELVRATMNLPSTWGYYIGDEHPENLPQIGEVSRAVRNITNRPLLYISRPSPAKLRPFKGLADYLGPDSYPVGPFDKPTCDTARWASRMVKRNLTMVLQAYSWSIDYPGLNPQWPSAGQMRQMRNQATRCGNPKLLLWFCFHCVTDYNPSPDSYWRQVAWAANGVNLGPSYRIASASAS